MIKIYQMETTSRCNARCTYCPHEKLTRKQGIIALDTVVKVADYCKSIGQKYIALHHMGEPLLHPHIGTIIGIFHNFEVETELSTNGILLAKRGSEILKNKISLVRIAVDYFYKNPGYIQDIKNFCNLAKDFNTEIRIHTIEGNDLSVFEDCGALLEKKVYDNWAGSVEGESNLSPGNECYFLQDNYVVVLWDGNIVPCCEDWNGKHVIGNINSIIKIEDNKAWESCAGCVGLQFASGGKWLREDKQDESLEG